MPSSDIIYETRDGQAFDGYLAEPEGDGKAPGIVVITSMYGLDDEMKELADAYAEDGFLVSVPDVFWRQSPGPTTDFDAAFERWQNFGFETGVSDIEDVIGHLRRHPRHDGKVGVLGFCFGGRYAHVAAARLGIDAAASFHATGIELNLDETPNITCPVSHHFGEDDPVCPMEDVARIRDAFAGHAEAEIVVYPGTVHNFSMPYKQGYDAAAAKASREAVLRCLRSM